MVTDQPVLDPSSVPADPTSKSPLDVLEEILQQRAPVGTDTSDSAAQSPSVTPNAPADATPPQMSAEEIAALEAERTAADKVALAAKQAEMESILQTPQNLAREAQENAAAATTASKAVAMDGYEIKQLDHTKIADQ